MNERNHAHNDISGYFSASSGRAAMIIALRWSRRLAAFVSGFIGRAKGVAKTFGRRSAHWARHVIGSLRSVATRAAPPPISGMEASVRPPRHQAGERACKAKAPRAGA